MAGTFIGHPQGIDDIPQFVVARTPRSLRIAMLRNNARHKGFVVYQDIQWLESEKRWYAWFYVRADLREVLEGSDG